MLLDHKLLTLQNKLMDLAIEGRFALAFSGGIDSRFIAYTALRAGLHPLLILAVGPHMARDEVLFAKAWAKSHSADLQEIQLNPLDVPEVGNNTRRRCYYCKKSLFTRLKQESQGLSLCDGTQASDLESYRPGVAALQELGIISPLLQSNLSKPEIRKLALQTGMDYSNQQARPCLLTRFAYDLSPTPQELVAIDKAEHAVENVLHAWMKKNPAMSMPDFRVRKIDSRAIELHLTSSDLACLSKLPTLLSEQLELAVEQETKTPMKNRVKIMEKLSGYFDR